ncbi:MAG TPA: ribosome-associated translation inhibitor RaiA [Gammaproteobacteria bacterium]|nr:ribosome-associated translation inhibitor RaiA [Gammaproteobacteria bacterium]HAU07007.1 ribosome-associated translation inhibitor RaiA [Gammaproteobacteria bacterium]
MQLNLSGQHIEITDSLREHVSNKFAKLTRHFDHMTHVHVVLSVEKQRQKAEATIHVSGANLFASDEHENMYTAIEHIISKLDRQIIKHKNKIQDHHQADGANMKHNAV